MREELDRFYALLARLAQRTGGPLPLRELLRRPLPQAGVYFFFEPGETRGSAPAVPRVVRVGTHALKSGARSTLRGRLGQHLGRRDGGGEHRASIFRLLVGEALQARGLVPAVPTWGAGSDRRRAAERAGLSPEAVKAAERPVEEAVSARIGAMPVVVLGICDAPGPESLRGVIERNAIGVLSAAAAAGIDTPSPQWLGLASSREAVRSSGLWNSNHVGEGWDPAFLDLFGKLVEGTAP